MCLCLRAGACVYIQKPLITNVTDLMPLNYVVCGGDSYEGEAPSRITQIQETRTAPVTHRFEYATRIRFLRVRYIARRTAKAPATSCGAQRTG